MPSSSDIARGISQFINKRRDSLSVEVSGLEKKLFSRILKEILDALETDQGIIKNTQSNISRINSFDKLYQKFLNEEQTPVLRTFVKDLISLEHVNDRYFLSVTGEKKKVESVSSRAGKIIKGRLGITESGKVEKGKFLDNFLRDVTVRNRIKQQLLRAVTSGKPMSEFLKETRELVQGNKNVTGSLQRHWGQFVYDTYQQYDRAYGNLMAQGLSLPAFIFTGSIIESTRKFCRKRAGKVFTPEEASEWSSDPDLIRVKGEVYIPLEDMGGPNCRHRPRWISKEMALRLRPDLKGKI